MPKKNLLADGAEVLSYEQTSFQPENIPLFVLACPKLATTEKVMISSGTTFRIIVTDGTNPTKSFEFPLNFQRIISPLSNNDVPMKEKAKNHEKEVWEINCFRSSRRNKLRF